MRKMTINGIPYLWKPLSFTNPDATRGFDVVVAFPENGPDATPLFLIDNNGLNPFGHMSYAQWVPTKDVHFEDHKEGQPTSW